MSKPPTTNGDWTGWAGFAHRVLAGVSHGLGLIAAVGVAGVVLAAGGGVIALTRQLANELAADNIRVNAVSPGFVVTALNKELRAQGAEKRWASRIPLGRYAEPREIAAACAFLASEDASYMTGENLVIDGGLSAVLRPDPVPAS